MTTRSDPPDAVDQLKRRARRRLIGAIVLALAAAVILPLLLESDPKPLGDEVSVRIPPIDNGKFINPLAPEKAGENAPPVSPDSKIEPRPGAVITPKKTIAEAERRVLGQNGGQSGPTPAPAPPAPPAPTAPLPAAAVASMAPSSAVAETTAVKVDASAAPGAQPAATGAAFAVQVGAFADSKVANDLVASLKSSGYATYTEAVPTPQGSVLRVRVGPYATRAAADAAVAKLKAAGHDRALVTNTK